MQVLSNGRKRRTQSEWREIIERYGRSGLSVREFCRRESLVPASLQRWQVKLSSSKTRENGAGEFIDVTPPPSEALSTWSVEVEFPDGRVLRMHG
jgi:transposase-like protein